MTEWSSTSLLADRDPEWRQVLKSNLRQIDWSESLQGIVDKILDDEVLTKQDGLSLFSEPNRTRTISTSSQKSDVRRTCVF